MPRSFGCFEIIFITVVFFWFPFAASAEVAPSSVSTSHDMLMRQKAESGTEDAFLECAKILESTAPSNRFELVAALDLGIESKRKKSDAKGNLELPELLQKQLLQLWETDSFNPALIRVLTRTGFEPGLARAAFLANERNHSTSLRLDMINLLGESRSDVALRGLQKSLGPFTPAALRAAALENLRHFESDAVAHGILVNYRSYPEVIRYDLRELLFTRTNWTQKFFQHLAEKKIFTSDLATEQLQKIAAFEDQSLLSQITNRWGGRIRPVPKQQKETVAKFHQVLAEKKGEASRGEKIFETSCAQCHQLFGKGASLGPDLTQVNRQNPEFLLTSLVDPDSFIRKSFLTFEAEEINGVRTKGLLVESSTDYFVLKTLQGKRVVFFRNKIKSLTETGKSLMPDDAIKSLSSEELRDLFAYLQLPVPPAAKP